MVAETLCSFQRKFHAGSTFTVFGISRSQFHESEADQGAEANDPAGRSAAFGGRVSYAGQYSI